MKILLSFYLLCVCVNVVYGKNILYIGQVPSKSHFIWNRSFAIGLVEKGYNVTFVSADEAEKNPPRNYHHITLEGVYDAAYDVATLSDAEDLTPLGGIFWLENYCTGQCGAAIKSNGLQQLLDYPPSFKFDLIVLDVAVCTCLNTLLHRFNYPPAVGTVPFLLPTYMSYTFGNRLNPAYIPWYGLPYTSHMTFIERVRNFFYTYVEVFYRYNFAHWSEHNLAKTKFGVNIPSMEKLERHISLLLANADPVLGYPQPVPPNIIPVGGLHAKKSKKIPEEFKKILDGAENGVIIFSLGTTYQSDRLPRTVLEELFDALGKVREKVIWKFESDFENVPNNVFIRKWIPQNDMLSHPNVKLLITHGGALSTQEALAHGIPMISMPFSFDQIVNTRMLVNKHVGLWVKSEEVTSDYFVSQIREVVDNPKYLTNARKISKAFHDTKESPLERAIFWAEYVMRNGGAEFLSPEARDMPFYKTTDLDILLFFTSILIALAVILIKTIRFILRFTRTDRKIKIN